MHLCLENHRKNLVSFWKGTYKGMDEGWEEYQILDHVWAVGQREPDLAQLLGWALSHQVSDSN